jgi:hypothetical protein
MHGGVSAFSVAAGIKPGSSNKPRVNEKASEVAEQVTDRIIYAQFLESSIGVS